MPYLLRSLLLAVCLIFRVGNGWADSATGNSTRDTQVLALAQSWAEAVGGNHPDQLQLVLDENYEHIHGTGLQENRRQFLEALQRGTRKYGPIHLEELYVRVLGDFALVTGKFSLKVDSRGKLIEGVNRFCLTMTQGPAGWKIVQFQATVLPSQS